MALPGAMMSTSPSLSGSGPEGGEARALSQRPERWGVEGVVDV